MKLNSEILKKIENEYSQWFEEQYAGKTLKERQKLGAFFTPPELLFKMLEKFDDLNDDILDPCLALVQVVY